MCVEGAHWEEESNGQKKTCNVFIYNTDLIFIYGQ